MTFYTLSITSIKSAYDTTSPFLTRSISNEKTRRFTFSAFCPGSPEIPLGPGSTWKKNMFEGKRYKRIYLKK